MKIAFYYFLLFLIIFTLQFSFLNVLFSFVGAPVLIISAGVIWTLRLGFKKALWLLIPLLVLYDVLGSGRLEIFSLYVIFLAYSMSFLSRRVLLENTIVSTLFYGIVIFLGVEFYHFAQLLIQERGVSGALFESQRWFMIFLVTWISFWFTKKIIFYFQNKIDQLRSDNALMIR